MRQNYTPRISGQVVVSEGDFKFDMSILKANGAAVPSCNRFFFEYRGIENGKGKIIHTYMGDGNPIPSFMGEPRDFEIKSDIFTFANQLWDSLDKDNRVSLFVRYINLADSCSFSTKIINK